MAKTVIALYDNITDAHNAISALRKDRAFTERDISLMAHDAENRYSRYMDKHGDTTTSTTHHETKAAEGAKAGAGIGAAVGGIGGLLVGLGVFAIPGVGPIVAAGPIATTIIGLAGGAAAGGLIGALVGAGIPEEEAHYYAEGVRRGGSLVVVRATDSTLAQRAAGILGRFSPIDIEKRAEHWRSQGWSGAFTDNDEDHYTTDRIRRERESYPADTRGSDHTSIRLYDYPREAEFREHFYTHRPQSNVRYDDYKHAYTFGAEMGRNDRYAKQEWNDAKAELHKSWAKRYDESNWEKFKDYVKYGWYKTKAQGYDATTPGDQV